MAVAYIHGSFLEKTARLLDRTRILRLTWPGRMRTIGELRGRVGAGTPKERAGVAVVKGLAVPVDSLKLQISHGCVRVSVRHSDVMRPLRWGERLEQWGRLPHRQRRRFLTPPGYGSLRRRRRPCSRPRRRCRTGDPRWWRVPTPSCSGVGEVGLEFEVPEVLGDRPAVLRCAARISANSTWTEGKSGARRFGALLPGPEVQALQGRVHGQKAMQFWLGRIVGQAGFQ